MIILLVNRLQETLDGSAPTIAVSITEPIVSDTILDIASVADVFEFRADKFPYHEPAYLLDQAKRLAALPLLTTIRVETEGGGWSNSEASRLDFFNALLPVSDGLDVELSAGIARDTVETAHGVGKIAIVSSHDFNGTPSINVLEEKLAEAVGIGADYTKFATTANMQEEYERLVAFTLAHNKENIIVVAMGSYGPLSRIALPSIGSRLTYAFAGEIAVAPGQLNYVETGTILTKLWPNIV